LRTYRLVFALLLLGGVVALLVALLYGTPNRPPTPDTVNDEIPKPEQTALERSPPGAVPGRVWGEPGNPPGEEAVLAEVRVLRVHGTVMDEQGHSLAGARVVPTAVRARSVLTDVDGNYEVQIQLSPEASATLRFSAKGYGDKQVDVDDQELIGSGARRVDVQLRALGERTVVSGTLRTVDGEPISGEAVSLRSRSLKTGYARKSDEYGRFSIPGVEPAPDYELHVRPDGLYQDYMEGHIDLTPSGLSVDIVLEPLPTARLTGHIVDAEGYAVPGLTLSVRSRSAKQRTVEIKSERDGFFVAEEAPTGDLTLTGPNLTIRGILLLPGSQTDVRLVIDWGDQVMTGQVVDDWGSPVVGARVDLSWFHQSAGIRSGSNRRTTTDRSGSFRFFQVGPGLHRLEVRADGYHVAQEDHEVARHAPEVVVRLQPISW
jgi:hypothetical protein